MNKKDQTTQTYNQKAKEFAKKFDSIRPRTSYIEEAFSYIKKENPKILEIGCGNGRDALEILKKTDDYLGIDISEELIKMAKEKVPDADFRVADVVNLEFPENLDIVIAFASLIHVDKDEFKSILNKIYNALNVSGVIYLSLKYSIKYQELTQKDEFGSRTYYHYSKEDIGELASRFSIVKEEIEEIRDTKWLEVILQKK